MNNTQQAGVWLTFEIFRDLQGYEFVEKTGRWVSESDIATEDQLKERYAEYIKAVQFMTATPALAQPAKEWKRGRLDKGNAI